MINCGNLLRIALVVVVLMVASGLQDKLTSCCKKVSSAEITEPILEFEIQKPSGPCVIAVIFYTKTGHYCSHLKAPWVRKKIIELRKAKTQSGTPVVVVSSSPPSSVSLLSIISSTTSSPSASTLVSSSSPPSSSYTSPSSTRKTSSKSNNE
uniref:Chemokine interleukin-8-like domain-containing protein n=1 Tax=Kryptolebias marmoratus TaxID=37003 RepID=A0A3Q3BHJ7_KRYMA